jgi:hypothetical protein
MTTKKGPLDYVPQPARDARKGFETMTEAREAAKTASDTDTITVPKGWLCPKRDGKPDESTP